MKKAKTTYLNTAEKQLESANGMTKDMYDCNEGKQYCKTRRQLK